MVRNYKKHQVGKLSLVHSEQAFLDGIWPRLIWGVFVENELLGEFDTFKEARHFAKSRAEEARASREPRP